MATSQRKHPLTTTNDDDLPTYDTPKRLRGGYGDDAPDDLYNEDDFEDDMLDNDAPLPPDEMDASQDIAFGDITETHRSRWARPGVPPSVWNTEEQDLNLQWLDLDMIGGVPLE